MSRKTEYKEIVEKRMRNVVVSATCDTCGKGLQIDENNDVISVHVITGHEDWGCDSADSIEGKDFCSLSCASAFIKKFCVESKSSTAYTELKIQGEAEFNLIRNDSENYKQKYLDLKEKIEEIIK